MNSLEKFILKQQQAWRARFYVDHRKVKIQRCTHEEFKAVLDTLKDTYTQIPKTTIRNKIPPKSFSLVHYQDSLRSSLIVYEDNKHFKHYITADKDSKNSAKQTINPMSLISSDFKIRTGKTLTKAFGKTPQYFKACVPSPISYRSSLYPLYTKIHHVNYEDFSSHYPACAKKLLPDANTQKLVNSYVLPDAEYQFAFYPETGHVAVFNEFDSHKFIKQMQIYGAKTFKTDILKHETYTVLMKASTEQIVELEAYYDKKNKFEKGTTEYEEAKLVLNKFLGMFEQNSAVCYQNYPLAHLAAVIKWRANITTLKLINKIGAENIIQACVDGLIHTGKVQGTTVKALGNLITEETNADFIQRGINQYIIFGKNIHKVHQGLDINVDSDDLHNWQASPKVNFYKFLKENYRVQEI